MKTTEPESKESKGQKPGSASDQGTTPSDPPDPNFPIETTGGPTDTGGGGGYAGPPHKG